jgi:hypothetical protein
VCVCVVECNVVVYRKEMAKTPCVDCRRRRRLNVAVHSGYVFMGLQVLCHENLFCDYQQVCRKTERKLWRM